MNINSLSDTIYLTFSHNEYAIAFFIGIMLSLLALIIKPSRNATLLLIGFSTLLLGFEYEKHIMLPLMEQTIESLRADGKSGLVLIRLFQKLLPIGFFVVGWGSIFFRYFTLYSKNLCENLNS